MRALLWRAPARALVVAAVAVAAFAWAAPAFASGGDILDSQTANTQIRLAVDESVTSNPSFDGQPWLTPAAGMNGAYSTVPGASWLAEVTQGGAPVNHRWDQYRAVFDLPSGASDAGVRLLVDNEATAMTINGVPFGCGVDATCNYFNGTRVALSFPHGSLKPTGNELLITVHNDETYATGGLTFAVVPASVIVTRAPSAAAGYAGQTLTASGAFSQNLSDDVSGHPITVTADNTVGTFHDNGDGTWSWSYDAAETGSGTITVTATDDRGYTATSSFTYAATPGPSLSLPGVSCLTVTNGLVTPYTAQVSNTQGQSSYYVFTELTPSLPEALSGMVLFGYSYGDRSLLVGNHYNRVPAGTSSLWVTLRPGNYSNTIWDKVEVPVCNSDTTPPVITHTITGTVGDNGWYTSDVEVSFSPTDAQSPVSSKTGCDDVSVTADTAGVTFTCTATSAGGTQQDSVTIKRDATAPTISAAATSSPNANGWYSGDVTVTFTCADAGSGIAACPADQVLTGEGTGVASAAETVKDEAGNTSEASNVVSANIDRTAPVVSFSPDGQTYDVDQTVAITCTATDALSGVDSSTCADVNAQGWSLGLGAHPLSATATDKAGNTGDGSGSYTVVVTAGGMCNLVNSWVSKAGVANSLCVKLRAHQLDAFRNELAAQRGKAISADHADTLTALSKSL